MKGQLFSSEVAAPYSQALMSIAQSHDLTDQFGNDIRALLGLLEASPDFRELIGNPVIQESDKKAVLQRIAGEETNPYLMNFLMLLVDKRRIFFLPEICQQFLALLRKLKNVVLAEVLSATELTEVQRQGVVEKIKTLTGAQDVELKTTVDRDLIGGVIIKVGSQIFDASLRGQLRRISLSLSKTS